MTSNEFKNRVLPLIEEHLKTMPCLWQTESNARNTWDMLVDMWPEDEPGMGIWDHIQDLVVGWIALLLEKQPLEDIRDYWDENADHNDFYYENRDVVEETGCAPWFPPLEEMCGDIARDLWGDVLSRVEDEGDRRRGEKEAFDSVWDEPREELEILADFLRAKRPPAGSDDSLREAIDQWIELCSAIPFSWPPAVRSLRLDEIGAGTLRLRLTYDGARMELMAAIPSGDLFIPSSAWERSFSLCATKVVGMGWNNHIDRISTAEPGTGHDFAVSLESKDECPCPQTR